MRYLKIGKAEEKIPLIGQGTAGIDANISKESSEQWHSVLKKGIDLGMTHIDTSELYGNGIAEKIVGEVIKEYDRDDLFITTKILPSRTTKKSMESAINASLDRLGLNQVDLYLIHWLEEDSSIQKIMEFLDAMVDKEKTRYIGVSNFTLDQVKTARSLLNKHDIITNQIRINIRDNLHLQECLPYYQDEELFLTAYSPLNEDGLKSIDNRTRDSLEELTDKYDATIQQIALAWLINHDNVITIPKTTNIDHITENAKAVEIALSKEELKRFEYKLVDGF